MPEPHEDSEPLRRRRARRRATAQQGPPQVSRAVDASSEQGARAGRTKPTRSRDARGRGDRDLAGAGTSQVGPTGAMRARDLNRPTAGDLAEAEAELTIVRRHWNPTGEPPSQPRRRRS